MLWSKILFLLLLITYNAAVRKTALAIKKLSISKRPNIAVTAKTFMDLAFHSNIFIDKTLLIQEILQNTDQLVVITRPARWGKSINLDMIRTFLQMSTDVSGNKLMIHPSMPMFRLFVHGEITLPDGSTETLKKPFLIAKHENLIDQYLNKRPLIFLDFHDIRGDTFADLLDWLMIKIKERFREHQHFTRRFKSIVNENINTSDVITAQTRLHLFNYFLFNEFEFDEYNVTRSVHFLCEVLHHFYKLPVFVLIDGYDAPIDFVLRTAFPSKDRENFFNFYANFLHTTFQNNSYLDKGIVTGVSPLTAELVTSGIRNKTEYTFLNGELMEFYGFNQWEVRVVFQLTNVPKALEEEINLYYGSYHFINKDEKIYNTYFIANAIAHHRIENWLDVSVIHNFYTNFVKVDYQQIKDFLHASMNKKAALPVNLLDDGRLSLNETELFSHAATATYDAKQLKSKLESFDHPKFIIKGLLYLYTLGYFSLGKESSLAENCTVFVECVNNAVLKNATKILNRHTVEQMETYMEELKKTTISTTKKRYFT